MSDRLTSRELEVLELLAKDHTSKELAAELSISTETARTHRKNLIRKLEVKTTGGLISKSFALGILTKTIWIST